MIILLSIIKPLSLVDFGAILLAASFVSYFTFHRYEPSTALPLVSLLVSIPAALCVFAFPFGSGFITVVATFLSYWSLILFFTVLYRVSPLHPLAKYPGPFLNKISKFRVIGMAWKGSLHHYYHQLHRNYGDIVRVGPNELSYCNVDGVTLTLSAHGLPKGPFYSGGPQVPSLAGLRDPAEHAKRRRIWNRAFNSSSLKEYDGILIMRSRQLMRELAKRQSEIVDISKWMEYFSFDFMGDMAFSFSFDMMKAGDDTYGYRNTLMGSLKLGGTISHLPWAKRFIRNVINPAGNGLAMYKLSEKMVGQRLKAGSMTRDLFYHLNNEDGRKSNNPLKHQLFSEGATAIIAGSDTTSTVIANLWYNFLRNPSHYARLRGEIDTMFPSGEEPFDQQRLSAMPFLHACINESLRLQPPFPSGSQRVAPHGSGGKMLGSHFIPEGSALTVHTYSLQRDPRYFSPYPNAFWPDRWLVPGARKCLDDVTKPLGANVSVVLDPTAFIPFSSGPMNCVGKGLAMNEIRVVVAHIVQRFDMKVAPGYDLDQWEKELADHFVMRKGALPVVLTDRT